MTTMQLIPNCMKLSVCVCGGGGGGGDYLVRNDQTKKFKCVQSSNLCSFHDC